MILSQSFILKQKNNDVAQLRLNDDGEIEAYSVFDIKRMPYLASERERDLYKWWTDRAIPEGRERLSALLNENGCTRPSEFLMKNLGLSLTDTYWLCPINYDLSWEDVNLYTHGGKILHFHEGNGRIHYSTSPNAAVTGSLDKEAVHYSDGWYLEKRYNPKYPDGQQNVNEIFVSELHRLQGWDSYTPYTVSIDDKGKAYLCSSKYFTGEDRELVPAYEVTGGDKSDYNGKEDLNMFVDICSKNGLDNSSVQNFLDYMIAMDYIISNSDRHWHNFGILRDPETLRFLSMAPIYDNGNSMFFDEIYTQKRLGLLSIENTGIEKLETDRLNLIHNKNIIDTDYLLTPKDVKEFYIKYGISEDRAELISSAYGLKLDLFLEFQHGFTISYNREMFEYLDRTPFKGQKPDPDYFNEHKSEFTKVIRAEIKNGTSLIGIKLLDYSINDVDYHNLKHSLSHNHNNTFTLICGLPYSGKTQYARSLADKYKAIGKQESLYNEIDREVKNSFIVVSMGVIRKILQNSSGEWNENDVKKIARETVEKALKEGYDVIYDATNLSRDVRDDYLSIATGIGIKETNLIYIDADIKKVKELAKGSTDFDWEYLKSSLKNEPPTKDTGWKRIITIKANVRDTKKSTKAEEIR